MNSYDLAREFTDDNESILELWQTLNRANTAAAETEARLATVEALKATAHWYAQQGHPIFPCVPGEKRPATTHGFKDASLDPAQIEAWWTHIPTANIGLPTGHQFDVIDVDDVGALDQVIAFIRDGHIPTPTGLATTPRGYHVYIPATGLGNSTNVIPGVDYRGAGGYVLAAPSRLTNGGKYRWSWTNLGAN
ncbi:bifunctional DNA primase/polymerase [Flaviflexus equikiangi]|uniref:Bifunctional DNA primase/polymerase n=1 Tax=Flaviflexus equikiangi TaxID=2758573 RepID=A0ABS2TCJ7_9ACTO|nr:bifunctional DNA primase/polymerase [Flaviflexus equikiangi]MBM9432364.1 bifunctional DNA primase/polymerase [Flaviflexus equikiangi]